MPFFVAAGAAVVGAGISAYGSIESSEATAAADKYNAAVAQNNAIIANNNASQAAAAGESQAEQTALQTRAKVGGLKANEAAAGVDVNSGSALDVRSSAQQLGELNAITVRSNAAKVAYGYQTQNMNDVAQAQLDQTAANNAITAGDINAAGNVVGGLSSAAGSYAKASGQTSSNNWFT